MYYILNIIYHILYILHKNIVVSKYNVTTLLKNEAGGLFFNKGAGLRLVRLWCRCFPVNFAKFLRTPFLTEHLWWLLQERANNIFSNYKILL